MYRFRILVVFFFKMLMEPTKFLITLITLSVFQTCSNVNAITFVRLRIDRFRSEGKDKNGDRCDPTGKCDPKFTFCIDRHSGNNNVEHEDCPYFREKTDPYKNDNSMSFDDNIKGMPNPIEVTIDDYEGIRFKARADDDDSSSSDDRIDRFDWHYRPRPAPSEREAVSHFEKIDGERNRDPASFDIEIWIFCVEHWFGERCEVYCRPQNSDARGHYSCEPGTGRRLCFQGWEGTECRDRIDHCAASPCANGGHCINRLDGYECDCSSVNYIGEHCELHLCESTHNHCQNGGSCIIQDGGNISCLCLQEFTGFSCDVITCDILDCGAHGVCIAGACNCEPNFLGELCDVRECEQNPCQWGGTCLENGECTCTPQYSGRHCEDALPSPCDSDPCLNSAQCNATEDFQTFQCICADGYEGELCNQKSSRSVGSRHDDKSSNKAAPWLITVIVLVLAVIVVAVLYIFRRRILCHSSSNNNASVASRVRSTGDNIYTTYDEIGGASAGDALSATAIECKDLEALQKGCHVTDPYSPPPYTALASIDNALRQPPAYVEMKCKATSDDTASDRSETSHVVKTNDYDYVTFSNQRSVATLNDEHASDNLDNETRAHSKAMTS